MRLTEKVWQMWPAEARDDCLGGVDESTKAGAGDEERAYADVECT